MVSSVPKRPVRRANLSVSEILYEISGSVFADAISLTALVCIPKLDNEEISVVVELNILIIPKPSVPNKIATTFVFIMEKNMDITCTPANSPVDLNSSLYLC